MASTRSIVLTGCLFLAESLAAPVAAQAPAPRVAVILDRESPRLEPLVDAFQREVGAFFRPGEVVLLPPVAGDGTAGSVSRVLNAALQDPTVSVVVALGIIGSHLLASSGTPPKPAIAGIIIDATWQALPQRGGASGVARLTYVEQSYPVGATLADFHRMIPFRRLAVLFDRDQLEAIPTLVDGATALVRETGAEAVVVPAGDDPDALLAAIPPGVDAVYLTPLPAMTGERLAHLLAGLNARRLPTLSYLAGPEILAGALASYEPPENWQRRARRVAVDLQRILAGEDGGALPFRLISASRLTLNLATARAIGFSPSRSLLTDAELVAVDSAGPADTLSLAATMRAAAAVNLDLRAAELGVASGEQEVRRVRSSLLPRIESNLSGAVTREGTAAASLGQQAERQLESGLSFSMPLFAERAWAGYSSERRRQEGREAQRDELRLDVTLDAATAYLNVLRAQTLAEVRRSNLYRTRSNLEIARLREEVGSASRADIFRWQGEVANARRDLITAEAQVRVAALDLNRLLDRPLDRPVAQAAVSLGDPALLAQDSTVLSWLDQPDHFARLTRFLSDEAARLSPELAQVEAAMAAQERQHAAAQRAFWLPSISLKGGVNSVLTRGGAGSSGPELPPQVGLPGAPDLSWQFRVQASLPLFTGFERQADRAQSKLEVERLGLRRSAIRLAVDQRVRAALETAASSYAAIALTREASDAANRNYDLVSDAYARGAASITVLIDAQTAALNASEAAANAIHEFLLDLMRVERAMGTFGVLQPDAQRELFLQRLHALRMQP